jgi:hypothetical protein
MEKTNKNAYSRCIYIHGTAEEKNIGKPVSYGCIRMTSKDVIDLFSKLPIGTRVLVTKAELPSHVTPAPAPEVPTPGTQPPIFLNPNQQQSGDGPMLAETKRSSAPDEGMDAPHNSVPAPRLVSKSSSSKSRHVASYPDTPEPLTETVALRETPALTRKPLPGGGAVLYSAPTNGSGPGLVLKSKRHASQGYAN